MDKKIIILSILLLIIAGAIIVMLVNSVNYERIDITPNGTSIDVPANKTTFQGDVEGVKIWNWDEGILATYNSNENSLLNQLTGFGFNALNELIKTGEQQNIDGFTCYVLNADELLEIQLFDAVKVNYNGKFYCIPLTNETTHDNIIICCKDKDIAVHMAKSVKYKNVFPNKTNTLNSTIDKIAGDLQSKTNNYLNNTTLDDLKSTIEEKTRHLESKSNDYINKANLEDAKSNIEKMAGNILFYPI